MAFYDISQMLADSVELPLPIDPAPVRRIFSGQSADQSGLDAMTQLVPAEPVGVGKSGRFFLLPLPPNVNPDDPSLFRFWTYEFRVGHTEMWSTAQGRYGLPKTSALSVLAVEILPGPFNISDQFQPVPRQQEEGEDSLETGLGTRRILRTSPLTAIPAICP
jgi:hypothetical protein